MEEQDGPDVLAVSRLTQILRATAAKEETSWKPMYWKHSTALGVTQDHRDEAASWLVGINRKFGFAPETIALAISTLDRFLHTVKVRPKYLRCVSVSCLYIAAKTLEEDENIPTTREFVQDSECGCSCSEVLRMERAILAKFHWDVKTPTTVDFLHIIHGLLVSQHPHLLHGLTHMCAASHRTIITTKLLTCLCTVSVLMYRPATIALAVLSLELEQFTQNWLQYIISLQQLIPQVVTEELISCREKLSHHLCQRHALYTSYTFKPHKHQRRVKSVKRKVVHIEDDDDTYDCIKRLYNEDADEVTSPLTSPLVPLASVPVTSSPVTSGPVVNGPVTSGPVRSSCSSQLRQQVEKLSYAAVVALIAN